MLGAQAKRPAAFRVPAFYLTTFYLFLTPDGFAGVQTGTFRCSIVVVFGCFSAYTRLTIVPFSASRRITIIFVAIDNSPPGQWPLVTTLAPESETMARLQLVLRSLVDPPPASFWWAKGPGLTIRPFSFRAMPM